MWFAVVLVSVLAVIAGGIDLAPTRVLPGEPLRTKPPTTALRPQYAQTLYKATDHSTAMNTLIPFWPTYEVQYQNTSVSTINNQTISTSTAELSTVMNTTVYVISHLSANSTVMPTSFQTIEFQHQTVLYTDVKNNITHTEVHNNSLPFV